MKIWVPLSVLVVLVNLAIVESVAVDYPASGAVGRSRSKRSTVSLPNGSVTKWSVTFVVPVVPLNNVTGTYLWFDLSLFTLIPSRTRVIGLYNSLTQLAQGKNLEIDDNFIDEQRTNQDRRGVYDYIEGIFSSFGLDGPTCMRRAICELSEAPLGHNGLLGKSLQILLFPSLTEMPKHMEPHFGPNRTKSEHDDVLDFISAPVHNEYTQAYHKGKEGKCGSHYSGCPLSIFKLLDI